MEYKGTPPDDQIYKDYIKALEEISNASAGRQEVFLYIPYIFLQVFQHLLYYQI
jgi:hypothetical protein